MYNGICLLPPLTWYSSVGSELSEVLQNVKNSDMLVAWVYGHSATRIWLSCLRCRVCVQGYVEVLSRTEHIRRAIFVPRGELLCKVEFVNWHSKYVHMNSAGAKYI